MLEPGRVFCSVVIPTIGRTTLARTVNSVLEQRLPPGTVEVIVVNDSGTPFPPVGWSVGGPIRLITTQHRERSVARNTGAAMARGDYLCFLDDDDWLLPSALEHLGVVARQSPEAGWLYGGIRIVDDQGSVLGEVNSGLSGNCLALIMGGAWAPIQASLIRAEVFFMVGGFDPSICGTEDLDLTRRVALRTDFANTPMTVACLLRGPSWDTSTDYQRAPADTLRSRDRVLDGPHAFTRLVASAQTSPQPAYWLGRTLRVYASTVRMNLRQKRVFAAVSRALHGLAICAGAAGHMGTRLFWSAARADHVPDTLHFVMQAYEAGRSLHAPSPGGPGTAARPPKPATDA